MAGERLTGLEDGLGYQRGYVLRCLSVNTDKVMVV